MLKPTYLVIYKDWEWVGKNFYEIWYEKPYRISHESIEYDHFLLKLWRTKEANLKGIPRGIRPWGIVIQQGIIVSEEIYEGYLIPILKNPFHNYKNINYLL